MKAQLLIKLLSDKHFFDLRRMQYKYGTAVVQELTDLLYHADSTLVEQLPICDFNSIPIVYRKRAIFPRVRKILPEIRKFQAGF